MKKIIYVGFWLCCMPLLIHAETEKESGLKVAYASLSEAMDRTGEKDKIRKAMEKEKLRIQGIIRKKNEQMNKKANDIKKSMELLSQDEKVKKYEELQKMQIQMEQFLKNKEIEFQKKEAGLKGNALQRIKVVVDKVAKQAKVDIIRNKDGLLWVRPKWDVTNKVVSMYKKKYK